MCAIQCVVSMFWVWVCVYVREWVDEVSGPAACVCLSLVWGLKDRPSPVTDMCRPSSLPPWALREIWFRGTTSSHESTLCVPGWQAKHTPTHRINSSTPPPSQSHVAISFQCTSDVCMCVCESWKHSPFVCVRLHCFSWRPDSQCHYYSGESDGSVLRCWLFKWFLFFYSAFTGLQRQWQFQCVIFYCSWNWWMVLCATLLHTDSANINVMMVFSLHFIAVPLSVMELRCHLMWHHTLWFIYLRLGEKVCSVRQVWNKLYSVLYSRLHVMFMLLYRPLWDVYD